MGFPVKKNKAAKIHFAALSFFCLTFHESAFPFSFRGNTLIALSSYHFGKELADFRQTYT